MRLSINAEHFIHTRTEKERTVIQALQICNNAGFKVVDITGCLEDENKIIDYLNENNMTVNQSHIPFNRYKKIPYDEFSKLIMFCAEKARKLGSKILVVHGDEFDVSNEYSDDAALEFNYKLFSPLVDFAAKNGMKVAFETLFEDNCGVPRYCSKMEQLNALVEKFPKEEVGICWDFGHARVSYEKEHLEHLKTVGDRLIATHVHDNMYGSDLHLFPFLGLIDWEKAMGILSDINYKGDFTFEFVYDRIPDELLPDYAALLKKTGDYLINYSKK